MDAILPKIPYAAGFGIQCATATSITALLSGHFMPNIGLLMLNAPQITYYTLLFEQQITTISILTIIHTTK